MFFPYRDQSNLAYYKKTIRQNKVRGVCQLQKTRSCANARTVVTGSRRPTGCTVQLICSCKGPASVHSHGRREKKFPYYKQRPVLSLVPFAESNDRSIDFDSHYLGCHICQRADRRGDSQMVEESAGSTYPTDSISSLSPNFAVCK